MIFTLILFVLSGLLTVFALPGARKIALKIGLVDRPNEQRKVHKMETPIVGGLLIGFISLFVGIIAVAMDLIFEPVIYFIVPFYLLFLFLGLLDDRFDVPARYKFLIQCIVAFAVVNSGLYLGSLNDLFDVNMPVWFLKVVSMGLIVGAINAYNLIDGIDGLLASFILVALFVFLGITLYFGLYSMTNFLLIFVASLIVFLKQNIGIKNKVFMGDAGALSLGFLLVVVFIYLFEKTGEASVQFGWIHLLLLGGLSFPILDTIIVFLRRLLASGSVFKADKTHFHHLVLKVFPKHINASLFIISLNLISILISLAVFAIGLPLLSFLICPICFLCVRWVILQIDSFQKAKQIIIKMER